MSAERQPRQRHEAELTATPVTVAGALGSFAGTRVASLNKARLPMPAGEFDASGYDFPESNRERDRAIFGAALEAATLLTKGFDEKMDILTEAADRVRWDRLVATGKYSGEYSDHRSPEEVADRAGAVSRMLNDPANAELFLPLISAKIGEMLERRTVNRAPRAKVVSKSDEIEL